MEYPPNQLTKWPDSVEQPASRGCCGWRREWDSNPSRVPRVYLRAIDWSICGQWGRSLGLNCRLPG